MLLEIALKSSLSCHTVNQDCIQEESEVFGMQIYSMSEVIENLLYELSHSRVAKTQQPS